MKPTFVTRAGRPGLVLAAAAAAAMLAAGPVHAQATFASADLRIAAGTGSPEKGTPAGGLTCDWRETGLAPFQLITYSCDAAVVGALQACVYKNKLVPNSPTQLAIVKNPLATLEGGVVGFVSNNGGRINGSTTTAVPVTEAAGGHFCTEPAQAEVVAVRWCSVALVDTVNNLLGASTSELFQQFYSGVALVPSCPELLASP